MHPPALLVPALLVIDVQKGLDDPVWGQRNNPQSEANIARLLAEWRDRSLSIVHMRHCSVMPHSPLRPELPGNAYKTEARPLPGEMEFTKTVNSAFIGTGLEPYLRAQGITALVVAGLTTDHCVSTSVRMAANLGFEVTLVTDATATFERRGHDGTHYAAEAMHAIALASLHGEFCTVQTTEQVLRSLA
ncbi:cysteine hydrolase family protein [Leptolyngbya sp. CCNP1308]|uniref:cysteine hydrolase family protein n=1 Tax=Leptolyngbya sp. CCNP1308 TaxID=3110255 RepID=UPI002B2063E3|nr:cysteine hydrolase family protein [Leptolyngbya sp. CCNP1308]MEA5450256.1 cysteine hydrolase family protein [Leptolyngbya sp. CCNP1308]